MLASAVAYVYREDEAGKTGAAKLPTCDEARRIAANIAKLPELAAQDQARLLDHLVSSHQ